MNDTADSSAKSTSSSLTTGTDQSTSAPNGQSEPKGKAYEFSKTRASGLLRDPLALKIALNRFNDKAERKKAFAEFKNQIAAMIRMVKVSLNGDYKAPYSSILSIVGCGVYVLMPVDAIPDLAPVFGYLDDIAVLRFTYSFVEDDLTDFKEWESQSSGAKIDEVGSQN